MADNKTVDNGGLTDITAATDEVTYSGDTADVPLIRPVHVTGSEGSKTVVAITDADGQFVQGSVAHDAADSGKPLKIGGKARTSEPAAVADGDRVDGYFDDRGRLAITEPTRTNTASLDLTGANTSEIDLDGKRSMAFRLSSLTGSGATVKFEVQAPGTGLWFFCASFNIVNAESGGIGTGLSNNYENETTTNGVWIATGLGGFRKFRVRVSTTGTGTATLDWSSTAASDYGFNHIFGDLQDDTPALAHWPVMIGGIAHTVVMPQSGGASANWANLAAPVSANNDRVTAALTRFRELRVLQSDHHLPGTIDASDEEVRIPTEGSNGIAIDIRGTWNPGSGNFLAFQQSLDGTNWMPCIGAKLDETNGGFDGTYGTQSGTAGTANANGAWFLSAPGAAYVRVLHTDGSPPVGTAWSSGSATVTIRGFFAAGFISAYVSGDRGHDATDGSTPPVKLGQRAINFGATPTAVAALDRTNWYANRHGVPFVLGGHPNTFSTEWRATTAQTNDDIVGAVSAGFRLVITGITATADNANTVDVGVRVGFGTASVPAEPADGGIVSGMVLSHPGIAPGSGVSRGDGSGILAVGADGEELRCTNEVPTGGSIKIIVTGFAIET